MKNGIESEPVVKKPISAKQKQKSKLRLSFGPGETTSMTNEDDGNQSEVIAPKRPSLGRRAVERSMLQRSLTTPSKSTDPIPVRVGQDQDRPSYSAEYLKELRDSTPSTPATTNKTPDEGVSNKVIDVAAKFGEVGKVSTLPSVIPSEAEIREKKARRARIAKEQEQDYISLDDTVEQEEENGYLDLNVGEKPEEEVTRLIRDDEDFAEGFDEFVEDGRISLGRKAERERKRRHREEMRGLIDEAEALSEEEDSDFEEKAAYENSQARAAIGMGNGNNADRSRTPPKVTSIPRLSTCIDRLRATLMTMENSRSQMVNRMEELRREKADIAVREVEIQALIKESGENYERLKRDAGVTPGSDESSSRGLENIGEATVPSQNAIEYEEQHP